MSTKDQKVITIPNGKLGIFLYYAKHWGIAALLAYLMGVGSPWKIKITDIKQDAQGNVTFVTESYYGQPDDITPTSID